MLCVFTSLSAHTSHYISPLQHSTSLLTRGQRGRKRAQDGTNAKTEKELGLPVMNFEKAKELGLYLGSSLVPQRTQAPLFHNLEIWNLENVITQEYCWYSPL